MTTAILVVPTEQRVGLTTVALGLVHALDREGIPVGFCKPISQPHASDTGPERSTRLARIVSRLSPPEPISVTEAENLLGHGRETYCWKKSSPVTSRRPTTLASSSSKD